TSIIRPPITSAAISMGDTGRAPWTQAYRYAITLAPIQSAGTTVDLAIFRYCDQTLICAAGRGFRGGTDKYEKNLKKDWFEGLTTPRPMPKMRATCSEQRNAENAASSQG